VCQEAARGFPFGRGDDAAIKVGLPPWLMPAESPLKFRAGPIYPKLPTEADAFRRVRRLSAKPTPTRHRTETKKAEADQAEGRGGMV
jgi:hypothetical protein